MLCLVSLCLVTDEYVCLHLWRQKEKNLIDLSIVGLISSFVYFSVRSWKFPLQRESKYSVLVGQEFKLILFSYDCTKAFLSCYFLGSILPYGGMALFVMNGRRKLVHVNGLVGGAPILQTVDVEGLGEGAGHVRSGCFGVALPFLARFF